MDCSQRKQPAGLPRVLAATSNNAQRRPIKIGRNGIGIVNLRRSQALNQKRSAPGNRQRVRALETWYKTQYDRLKRTGHARCCKRRECTNHGHPTTM